MPLRRHQPKQRREEWREERREGVCPRVHSQVCSVLAWRAWPEVYKKISALPEAEKAAIEAGNRPAIRRRAQASDLCMLHSPRLSRQTLRPPMQSRGHPVFHYDRACYGMRVSAKLELGAWHRAAKGSYAHSTHGGLTDRTAVTASA